MSAALVAGLAALAGSAPSSVATGTPDPLLASARMQGFFAVTGVVTAAVGVPGEHRGQLVARIWAFIPQCPSGPCPTTELVRQRAGGYDRLALQSNGAGGYSGAGSYEAPLRCHGRVYGAGERVPFTITVTVTGAVVAAPGDVEATQFAASYRNRRRTGLTRCVTAPGHDSASYVGSSSPGAATPTVARMRSSPAS